MMVVQNQERYKELLEQVNTGESKLRRQTPLVNAGYAARVLAISHSIQSFVAYHQQRNNNNKSSQILQIVLLGCGADVIGMWAHSLLDPSSNTKLRIVEMDMPEVCSIKRDVWIRNHLVDPIHATEESSERLVGHIRKHSSDESDATTGVPPNYVLCPVDLREISQLDEVVQEFIDIDAPTLAISELVLAYLPPEKTDELLAWCSSSLCTSPGSSIVALEPLGYDDESSTSSKVISVSEGYRREYCKHFGSKMERGKSANTKGGEKAEPSTFHPIGASCKRVEKRFVQSGFESTWCQPGNGCGTFRRPEEICCSGSF